MKIPERVSSDIFLVATSVLIACVIWLIAKGNDRAQDTFAAPLVLENQPGNVLTRLPRDQVNLTANFPKNLQAHMLPGNFQVVLDWNDLPTESEWIGVDDYLKSPLATLDPRESVRAVHTLPQDLRSRIERHVEYLNITPSKAGVEARYITRPVELTFSTRGDLPSGYRLSGEITPVTSEELLLTASPGRFRELGATAETSRVLITTTEPIDLANRKSTSRESVRLLIPDDTEILHQEDDIWKISTQRRIEVRIPIAEVTDRQRTMSKVLIQVKALNENLTAVLSEKLATLTLQGPERALQRVKASDLVARPETPPDERPGVATTVTLQGAFANPGAVGDLASQVQFIGVEPKSVGVQFIWRWRPEQLLENLNLSPAPQP